MKEQIKTFSTSASVVIPNSLVPLVLQIILIHLFLSGVKSEENKSLSSAVETSHDNNNLYSSDQLLSHLFPGIFNGKFESPAPNSTSGSATPGTSESYGINSLPFFKKLQGNDVLLRERVKTEDVQILVVPNAHEETDRSIVGNVRSVALSGHQGMDQQLAFYSTLLLAVQEAKCFQDFGGTRRMYPGDVPLKDDLWDPFVCPTIVEPLKTSVCEQCRNLTKAVPRQEDCQVLCKNSQWNCLHRCTSISTDVNLSLEEYRIYKESFSVPDAGGTGVKCETFGPLNECLRFSQTQNDSVDNSQYVFNFEAQSEKSRMENKSFGKAKAIETVQVFCEGVISPNVTAQATSNAQRHRSQKSSQHFIVLKTQLRPLSSPNSFSPNVSLEDIKAGDKLQHLKDLMTSNNLPIVFVTEQRERESWEDQMVTQDYNKKLSGTWSEWKTLGKSSYGFDEIHLAYLSRTYQWRVTAVSSLGIVDQFTTEAFTTLSGYVPPGRPQRIFVINTKASADDSVDVLIGWEPPEERACFYKIVLENLEQEEKLRTVRIKDDPIGVHRYWFRNLKFGTQYIVRITSRSAGWHDDESTQTRLNFLTPTCLQVHGFQFIKCAPTPPRNLSASLRVESDLALEQGDSKSKNLALQSTYSLSLRWLPPEYATDTNVLTFYTVKVTSLPLNLSTYSAFKQNGSKGGEAQLKIVTLPGNTTQLTMKGLQCNRQYQVSVYAASGTGASTPARILVSTKPEPLVEETRDKAWVYILVPLSFLLTITCGCHLGRHYVQKSKVRAARNLYFKSMEEHDAIANDWSMIPSNEEYSVLTTLQNEIYPKGVCDLRLLQLRLGDVIGHGAFGVVRRAELPKKMYIELEHKYSKRKRRSGLTAQLKASAENEDAMVTVAVKMLKVASSKSDHEEIFKEIATMQSLGPHPQIVSLLGASSLGSSFCLILEYCPGGDLLSYLRKVREEYLPMLNLCLDDKYERRSSSKVLRENSTSVNNSSSGFSRDENPSRKESLESGPISYADVGSFSESSSSSLVYEQKAETTPSVTNDTGYSTAADELITDRLSRSSYASEKHVYPITERDVLSYGRQIAMGMAYLERNHVVHRDLACRNILLMGDYKHVKISDFGLSRDVYTWNVYHQKSNGKLPFKWMAIESIFGQLFTSKSDVWSYGVLLWELVTLGGNPYPGIPNNELFRLLKSGYRMERPGNCSEELYALMKKCWRPSPTDRPSFGELRHHLESMLEAFDPTMYLSLQEDLHPDHFSSIAE